MYFIIIIIIIIVVVVVVAERNIEIKIEINMLEVVLLSY